MPRRKILCLVNILLFKVFPLQAQQYPFVHYTPKDGLVNSRVVSAYQDSKGRIYFTTYGGLSVYDGSRFTNYTTDNGLASNHVNQVIEMGDDSLWVIPNADKVHCLVHGKLKDLVTADNFYPVINKLIKCSDGKYYGFADGGLYRYENNRFSRLSLKDKTGREVNNYFLHGGEINNKIYLITDATVSSYPSPSYLVVYDMKTGETIISKKPPDIYFFTVTPQKDILIATSDGLKSLDKTELLKGQIRFIPPPRLYKRGETLKARYLYFDREDNLWILNEYGILKINDRGKSKLFTTESGLSVNFQSGIFQDKENIMWFLNEQTGISKLVNHGYELQSIVKPGLTPYDIYADPESDSVWFIDPFHKKLVMEHPGGSREFNLNFSVAVNKISKSGKTIYLAGNSGLYAFDIPEYTNKIDLKFLDSTVGAYKISRGVGSMMPDKSGNLVFSNFYINTIINKKVISYFLGAIADQFCISASNQCWVTTRGKDLFLFQLNAGDTSNYFQLIRNFKDELPIMSPRSVAIDRNGVVWIGSRDHGLFCFHFDKDFQISSWQQLTTKNGLSDNFISYIHCDPEGNIWACSPVGLDKVQLKNKKLFIENITRANNMYLNVIKIATSKNGVKWVRTSAGIMKIEPLPFSLKTYQPEIFFTNIEAGINKISGVGSELTLSHKENDISFYVAAPSFIDEKQTRFSYRLKGRSNEEWSEPSANSEIRLINLASGKYSMEVKASFINGAYPDTQSSYSFEVLPPWWQTWWFKILSLVLLAAITAALVRSYFQGKLHKQKKLLENQQAIEKERSRIASDMHDDLGAGLSTIRFLSEKVKRNSFSAVTREDADKIVLNSNDLVQKMNEIIWAMNEKNDTLEDLLFYTRSYAMEYCEENNLECEVQLPEDISGVRVTGEIRRNIFLIIKESLHNIVKHAEASKVIIQFWVHDHLFATISDNGKGLSYKNKTGRGNGLLNMQKRIKLLGGGLDFKNENGLTVEFSVPLKNQG